MCVCIRHFRSAEVEMLATDLERANLRVITAEKQFENYRRSAEQRLQNQSPETRVSNY